MKERRIKESEKKREERVAERKRLEQIRLEKLQKQKTIELAELNGPILQRLEILTNKFHTTKEFIQNEETKVNTFLEAPRKIIQDTTDDLNTRLVEPRKKFQDLEKEINDLEKRKVELIQKYCVHLHNKPSPPNDKCSCPNYLDCLDCKKERIWIQNKFCNCQSWSSSGQF